MRHNFLTTVRRVAILAGLMFTAACGTGTDLPTGLTPDRPQLVKLDKAADKAATDAAEAARKAVKVLARSVDLATPVTASAVIGKDGGTIQIKETGFTLRIPAGALDAPTTISVTAQPGSNVAYEFAPHGLVFKTTVWFEQDGKHTKAKSGALLLGGYFADPSDVLPDGTASVLEQFLLAPGKKGFITFGIKHFSGYLVSCA